MPELRHVPIGLIDEPPLPIRATMDDGKMRELADSLRDIGLQQPITVILEKPACGCPDPDQDVHFSNCDAGIATRYRIVTGHRRFIAHQMIGATEVLCIIRKPGEVQEIAAMIAENACREDVNPAEEAIWFHQLVSEHGYTEEQLMQLTKRNADYIGDRFRLLRGDEMVFAAVQAGDISYAVGRELNKLEDLSMRRYYLDAAIRGGNSSRVVRRWVEDWRANQGPPASPQVEPVAPVAEAAANPYKHCCVLCGGDRDPWNFLNITVHKWEWEQIEKAMKEAAHGV
jgi:ParB/RepB/Spo0J family partition protein